MALHSAGSEAPIRPKHKREDVEMDITPMIDVTFLLMIFFIVASKIDPQSAINLPNAKYGDAVPERNCAVIVVAEGPGDRAHIYLGNAKDPATLINEGLDAEEQEKLIAEYVDRELHRDGGKERVLVKGEKKVKTKDMNRVYSAVSRVMDEGSIRIGVQEKQ